MAAKSRLPSPSERLGVRFEDVVGFPTRIRIVTFAYDRYEFHEQTKAMVDPNLAKYNARVVGKVCVEYVTRDDPRVNRQVKASEYAKVPKYWSALNFLLPGPGKMVASPGPSIQEILEIFVPYTAGTAGLNGGYIEELRDKIGGTYRRNAPNSGLLISFDQLQSKILDPSKVHPLIRDFYENTVNYKLIVKPFWDPNMIVPFKLFRERLAEPMGQANIPSDFSEAKIGFDSYIDTIDIDNDGQSDLHGWIRTYKSNFKPIYVGIYTVKRLNDRPYAVIGFPFAGGTLNAIFEVRNQGSDLVLTSENAKSDIAGDYLLYGRNHVIESGFRIPGFREEIHVFVRNGKLFADHQFFLFGRRFLLLKYSMFSK